MPNLHWLKSNQATGQESIVLEKTPVRSGSRLFVEGRQYTGLFPAEFAVYRTYSRLVTRFLRKRGKPTMKLLGRVEAHAVSATASRSDAFLAPAVARRLKVPIHAVDDLENRTPTIFSTRFGGLEIGPSITIAGAGGGLGSAKLITAVDPEVSLTTLLPWPSMTADTVHGVIEELAEDASSAAEEESPSEVMEGLLAEVGWALPEERPDSWEIWLTEPNLTLGEGEAATITINATTPTPGVAAFALQATEHDANGEDGTGAVSDIMVIECDETGVVSLTFL